MKTLLIDLDGTLTIDEENVDYIDKKPNFDLIQTLKEYKKQGFKIYCAYYVPAVEEKYIANMPLWNGALN